MNPYHLAAEGIGGSAEYELDFSGNTLDMGGLLIYERQSNDGCNMSKPGGVNGVTVVIIVVVVVIIVVVAAALFFLKMRK